MGRSLPRGELGLPDRGGQGSGGQGLRRGAVRLRALPHRRQALGRALLAAQQRDDPPARHRRLPGQGASRAGPDRSLPRRGRLRLHRVQLQRHRHRAAHRGALRAPRLHVPDGVPVRLSPGHPGRPESGEEPVRGRARRACGSPASAPRTRPCRCGRGCRTSRTTPSTSASSARDEVRAQIRGAGDGGRLRAGCSGIRRTTTRRRRSSPRPPPSTKSTQ